MKKLIIALCLVLLFLFVAFAFSQEKGFIKIRDKRTNEVTSVKIYDKSYAVCIGIDDYLYWQKLNCAVADAMGMKAKLLAQGFDDVKLIRNEEATKSKIEEALSWLSNVTTSNDRAVIYFSGHGHTVEGRSRTIGYIIPVDCPKSDYYANAISMTKLKEVSESIKAKHVLYIMDSCYSGVGLVTRGADEDFLIDMTKDPCVYMMTAGKAGELALETEGHGIFTRYVLRGMDGEADYDKNGVVSSTELGLYCSRWVSHDAKELNTIQTPQFGRLDGEGEIVFVPKTSELTIVKEIVNTATLFVDSDPTGADVYVDNKAIGKTPCSVTLDTGVQGNRDVIVAISKDGYVTKRGQVTLEAGKFARWSDVRLDKTVIPIPEPPKQTIPDKSKIVEKDDMVLIPAGEFQMGSNESSDEKPIHTVYLDAFYIDKYEVTNAQYRKFMNATGYKAPVYWNNSNYNDPKQPVVGVSWNDAKAYADWIGKRLPTEAEWEKAARGGVTGKKYVWGDEWPPPDKSGNFDDETTVDKFRIDGYSDGYIYTSPVGSFKPNGYGLYDMAGNVWEWCADWYDSNYYANSPKSNPTGPSSGQYKGLRGGSWLGDGPGYLRVSYRLRNFPVFLNIIRGFRCASLRVSQ